MTADLQAQLAEAQRAETKAEEAYIRAQEKLSAALEVQDFALAEKIKSDVPAAELEWVGACRATAAVAGKLEFLNAEAARREAEAFEAESRRQARARHDAAFAVEQAARDEAQQHWADVRPGIAAVRESMRAAVDAYQRANHARREAHESLVALGEAEPTARWGNGNNALVAIQQDRVLSAIFEGRQW